jgi:two-component system response regulator RegA
MRAGVSGYFAKPVCARQLLDFLHGDGEAALGDQPETEAYLTLGRAHWEYINLTLDASGSIAEAARRLGVHRRSLRRMLSKYPPPL